jgi:hypothetical protein
MCLNLKLGVFDFGLMIGVNRVIGVTYYMNITERCDKNESNR